MVSISQEDPLLNFLTLLHSWSSPNRLLDIPYEHDCGLSENI